MNASSIVSQSPNALSLSRLALGICFPLLPESWRLAAVGYAILGLLLDPLAD